jgi:hypothetical protein
MPDAPAPRPAPQRGHAAPAPEGIVYSCSGAPYAAEAVQSARSSLRHNRLPHLLFTSVEVEVEGEPGLSVAHFEPSGNPYLDKIANMRRSPFERTIYLDTDTFVVDEIAHLLALLDHYDVAAAFSPGLRGLRDPEVPQAFYELNTGVVAWRASERMREFMRDWEQTYADWLRAEPFPGAAKPDTRHRSRTTSRGGTADQPAFRRCAWQSGLRLFVLAPEYNLRLGVLNAVVAPVRVIHGRHRNLEGLAARINDTRGPRSWPRAGTVSMRIRRRWKARRERARAAAERG